MNKILINCGNLSVGGGVQVAASMLENCHLFMLPDYKYYLILSPEVKENLSENFDFSKFHHVWVEKISKFNFLFKSFKFISIRFKLVYSIFGPCYAWFRSDFHVVGFAQPAVIYRNYALEVPSRRLDKFFLYLRSKVQEFLFRSYDFIFVEADHVKSRLLEMGFNHAKVIVCSNSLHQVFYNVITKKNRRDFSQKIVLGFMGRAYPHKNLQIIPEVVRILQQDYAVSCSVRVTLTEKEMSALSFDCHSDITSIGKINISQAMEFYNSIDLLVFPSLLECFSITPIEAMSCGVPVVCSDRPFMREIYNHGAVYVDPLCPASIAKKIASLVSDPSSLEDLVEHAYSVANNYRMADQRTAKVFDAIHSLLDSS